jgi:integrase/recombinase XerD
MLDGFIQSTGKVYMEDLTRADVQLHIAQMIAGKKSPATVKNVLTAIRAFLRKQGLDGKIVQNTDAPRIHKKLPHIYTQKQISALLAASSNEDRLVWSLFLATGLREQELSHLGYEDVLFERSIVHLHAKPDLKFKLKDAEERQIPLPADLVEQLKRRRELRPKDRLVFPTDGGFPEGHFLRRLKEIAFKAKLNCGLCKNRVGIDCSVAAVCGKWTLHSFRRTAATRWHEAGLSVPTVQRLLGHSDVDTTMHYLTGQDLSGVEFRATIDRCFAGITA